MNRHFADYINIARDYNIPFLTYVTNGQLFTDEVIVASIKAPVHEIVVSIDAATKNLYEEIRVNASFDRLINNIKRVNELKREYNAVYPMITINFTAFRENRAEAPLLVKKYHEYFDFLRISNLLTDKRNESNPYNRLNGNNFCEMVRQCEEAAKDTSVVVYGSLNPLWKPPLLCGRPIEYVVISSKGDVQICNKEIIGNIYANPYKEIFESNKQLLLKMCLGKDAYCHEKCGS